MSLPATTPDSSRQALVATAGRGGLGISHWAQLARDGRLALPVVLGLLSIGFGLFGWVPLVLAEPGGTLPAGLAAAIAHTLGGFVPDPKNFADGNTLTHIGAGFGMAATTITGVIGATALLADELLRLRLRWTAAGHVVIIGETALAARLATGLGDGLTQGLAVQIVRSLPAGPPPPGLRRVAMAWAAPRLFTAARLARARTIIIDLGDDARSLALAGDLAPLIAAAAPAQLPSLHVVVANRQAAERILDSRMGSGALRPGLFAESEMLARETLAICPLFVQAAARGQARVHAIIIGFGALGEALLDQIMLTSLAGGLAPPLVTILDGDATAAGRFAARRPHVLETLEIAVLPFDSRLQRLGSIDPASALAQRLAAAPATALFVALPDALEALALALLPDGDARLHVPILYRCPADEADALAAGRAAGAVWPWDGSGEPPLIRIGAGDAELARAFDPARPDELLARRLHEVYTAANPGSGPAKAPWPQLAETYRRANIRAAEHLAAKLWSLGLPDFTGRLPGAGRLPMLSEADRAALAAITSDDPRVKVLAELEHGRWMIDRLLDGWRPGPARDNARRIHPLLVPWAELAHDEAEVAKDRRVVLETLRAAMAG